VNADTLRAEATVNYGGNPGWPSPLGAMAPTLEECELLYALVRSIRPNLVYESGTGVGISAAFIATALQRNGTGRLLTYEPVETIAEQAEQNLAGLPVDFSAGAYTGNADLVYLDSQPGLREREIVWWLERRSPALVVVHDSARQYPELAIGVGVNLPTAYGLWVGR
jgi:predicted O-methyltransferase YrrM